MGLPEASAGWDKVAEACSAAGNYLHLTQLLHGENVSASHTACASTQYRMHPGS